VSIGRLSGVGALWDCVSRVCGGGGGCASGGVPLGAGPCCPDVGRCLSGVNIIIIMCCLLHEGTLAGKTRRAFVQAQKFTHIPEVCKCRGFFGPSGER